jgi:lipid-A-disaccharide synthase
MKYYLIAGEASGDLHASNLMEALQREDKNAHFRFWGGDRMENAGGELVTHYEEMDYMGFWEVLINLPAILRKIRQCKRDIDQYQPDVVILVDYPGFNLRIAKYAKKKGYKVFYYISPQVWAWRTSRVKTIKKYVDHMFVILPFEQEFYQQQGVDVDYVGHPLLDVIDEHAPASHFRKDNQLTDKPIVAILPGSRKQEISTMLPVMLQVQPHFPDYQFVVAGVPTIPKSYYQQKVAGTAFEYVYDQTKALLSHSEAALVTSGTATLETALFEVPQTVCYKGNYISYLIGKWLVHVSYISLVNLILDKPVIKEFIQKEFTVDNLQKELHHLLEDESYRQEMITAYQELKDQLGERGASTRTAQLMFQYLQ